jgi:hypothetical protein
LETRATADLEIGATVTAARRCEQVANKLRKSFRRIACHYSPGHLNCGHDNEPDEPVSETNARALPAQANQ